MRHPARFNDQILATIDSLLPETGRVLDPFAGTGRIHQLATVGRSTWGVEIEPEWAAMHPQTRVGDATNLPAYWLEAFDAVATSPCYGNRMADHHEAKDNSRRNTYRHALGRPLSESNSGAMQWGDDYRDLHRQAWDEVSRVLKPGGIFILNISDHIRAGVRQRVTAWHVTTILGCGFDLQTAVAVETPRNRFGANGDLRVGYESVIRFEKGV